MSRPPSPRTDEGTTTGVQNGDLRRLDYLPLAYADLLALEENLGVARLGRPRGSDDANDAPDTARTFMELSALVGHVLSVYQRYLAGEAFISTAQAPSSLVRHAHRLAYEPDAGLSATGYVVLFAKPRVSGTVAAGLSLASVPLGTIKAQDYETRDDLLVDSTLNELVPANAKRPVVTNPSGSELVLQGTGHRIAAGDPVVLVGPAPTEWRSWVATNVSENAPAGTTTIRLNSFVGSALDLSTTSPTPTLLAHPTLTLRLFASDADPALYDGDAIRNATDSVPTSGSPRYWFSVHRADVGGYQPIDIYLSEKLHTSLLNTFVVAVTRTPATTSVFKVTGQVAAAVTLNRASDETYTLETVALTSDGKGGFTSSLTPTTATATVESHVSGTVTALQLEDRNETKAQRKEQPVSADWLAGWTVQVPLATEEPNDAALSAPLVVPGLLTELTPGRPLVLSDLAEEKAQVVTVRRATIDRTTSTTSIWWDAVTDPPSTGWKLHDLKVFANVARVSHGRSVQETLGGSDGVSAFQSFALKESPVTILPSVAGGTPALEVRVDDVRWDLVADFGDSGPDDRHYRAVVDENRVTSVVFGDGRSGAVPSSGAKNITAQYRVGLGTAGNVEVRRLTRLKRAHPLLDRVVNVTPVAGGAEPADAAAIRTQSTRWIRTFDRAVSLSDLADLALTMPGVARASSRWDQALGATLVVATAEGAAPPALDAVRAFLDARRDVSLPLALDGPTPKRLRVDVEVDPDPAYVVEIVKNSLRDALCGTDPGAPGMFTFPARELGQPAFLSEVYQRLEGVAGVIGVRITAFYPGRSSGIEDVVTAAVNEWLRLLPNDLTLTASSGGTSR